MKYELKSPCLNCPFRNDIQFQLDDGRVREIEESLNRASFPCHKTVNYTSDGETEIGPDAQHCAGALILLEKLECPSQMMRIAERLGMYDRKKLNMDAPVFDSFDEMNEACA